MFSFFPQLEQYIPQLEQYTRDNVEFTKNKLEQAIVLKAQYEKLINQYTNNLNELNKLIEEYKTEIENSKKTNYFEEIQRKFKNKYGSEPYLDTFISLYNELSKNKNITLQIVKDQNKGYSLLVEAGGLNEYEKMKLKLLKDMFEHVNKMI